MANDGEAPRGPVLELTIPGRWADPGELARRVARKSEYAVGDGRMTSAIDGHVVELDWLAADASLAARFAGAGRGRVPRHDLRAVEDHTTIVRLRISGGAEPRAKQLLDAGAALVLAGGAGVLVHSAGLAHGIDDWLDLAGDPNPGGVYRAFVIDESRGDTHFTTGMHAFGRRDVIVDEAGVSPHDREMILHQFNGYAMHSGVIVEDGAWVGDEEGPLYRIRAEPCATWPAGDPRHNPYGMWRHAQLTPQEEQEIAIADNRPVTPVRDRYPGNTFGPDNPPPGGKWTSPARRRRRQRG